MWFGTSNGLNKFDGYTFQVFQPNPDDQSRNLRHNIIWDIGETSTGQLYITTMGGGIHHVNKVTGQVTAYPASSAERNIVYKLCIDQKDQIWAASSGGLNQFDPLTKRYTLWNSPVTKGRDKTVWSVLEDSRGTLWVGTADGLYQLDRKTKKFSRFALAGEPDKAHLIIGLYEDQAHSLWVASLGKGLYRIAADGPSAAYRQSPTVYLAGYEIFPNAIGQAAPGVLWVGTHGGGLKRLDIQTGQYTSLLANPAVAGSINNNSGWSVKTDRQGILWVGTDNGINVDAYQVRKFQPFQLVADVTAARLPANNITTLYEDRQGVIWLGNTWGHYADGLYRFDRRRNRPAQLTHYVTQPGNKGSLLGNNVHSIYEDHAGTMWVGTLEGLHRLDQRTGRFTPYPTTITVLSIQEDDEHNLWLGGAGGLARWERRTGKLQYYPANFVNKLLRSASGAIWIGFAGDVLGQIDPRTGKMTRFPRFLSKQKTQQGINNSDVRALYEDAQGILWIGTNFSGLNRLDPRTGTYQRVTMRNGLPSNHIAGIEGDSAGHLWLATGRGLCRYDPRTRQVTNFTHHDGLQDDEFNETYAQANGELLFGGPNGFNVFRPEHLRRNTTLPPVYITKVSASGKVLPSAYLSTGPLELAHNENFISFDFVALNYLLAEKNQYAYRLEGLDPNWATCGTRRYANYTDLRPGTYTFRVKASNNDGLWNPTDARLTIIIRPPWWATWWAYGAYALLGIAAVWTLSTSRSRALRQKNYRLEQKVAERTTQLQQSLNDLKATQAQLVQREKMASLGELTAGIAHEIQNPLNFVNNFAEVSEELVEELKTGLRTGQEAEVMSLADDLESNLNKIVYHGRRAELIVKGMLLHSRSDVGEKRLADLNTMADEYLKLSYQGARANNQAFNTRLITHFDESIGEVSCVPQEIGRVLLNLYTNAFYAVYQKQLASPAEYEPAVTITTRRADPWLEIIIRDNGLGIEPAIMEKIFQPFFTTKPTGQGTGLGLSLSYDIITKGHGGTLTVASDVGQFTEFTVRLPASED